MNQLLSRKSAIIKIRKTIGVPDSGFVDEHDALSWYKSHYRAAKGAEFKGTFGFHYDSFQGTISFEVKLSGDKVEIPIPFPLDIEVPLDKSALDLAREAKLEPWAEALRLIILIGEVPEFVRLSVPDYTVVPLGHTNILVHPILKVSLRRWRRTGEMMGLLGKTDISEVPGITMVYGTGRMKIGEPLYWQTLLAYGEAIAERRKKKMENWMMKDPRPKYSEMIEQLKPENLGRKGLLRETAKILVAKYGWKVEEESYTIRRFLDRAEKIWHISS